MTSEATARLRRLPRITRARGYRLYAADGRRFIDLWQGGGHAVLGHRGAGVERRMKAMLDRGLLVAAPSSYEHRLERALARLLGSHAQTGVAVYRTFDRALEAIGDALGTRLVAESPADPAVDAISATVERHGGTPGVSPSVSLWRPFVPGAAPERYDPGSIRFLLPVLPTGTLSEAQPVVAFGPDAGALRSDLVAAASLAALEAACDALASAPERPAASLAGFASAGPYLMPMPVVRGSAGTYDSIFDRLLERGIVLSPEPDVPSIMPADLSDGEAKQLEEAAGIGLG